MISDRSYVCCTSLCRTCIGVARGLTLSHLSRTAIAGVSGSDTAMLIGSQTFPLVGKPVDRAAGTAELQMALSIRLRSAAYMSRDRTFLSPPNIMLVGITNLRHPAPSHSWHVLSRIYNNNDYFSWLTVIVCWRKFDDLSNDSTHCSRIANLAGFSGYKMIY